MTFAKAPSNPLIERVNLHGLATDLALVEAEARHYGMTKALRDRLLASQSALIAVEAERERRS